MEKKNTNGDRLAFYSSKPDLGELSKELTRSLYTTSELEAINASDDIRFCRWAGQSDDGKKHSENLPNNRQAFPFEGASDVRTRLIDSTINELACVMTTAFERSELTLVGTELNDMSAATGATTLVNWVTKQKLRNDILREAELGAQYALQYGWTVFNIGWDQQISKRMQKITLDEVAAIAQQSQSEALMSLPELILNPEAESQAIQLISMTLSDFKIKDIKKLVRSLRETGEGEVEEQFVSKNLPCITALKPYDEVAFPPETIDLQRARVIFRRVYMTEVELRSAIIDDEWNKDFVDVAVSTAGKQSWYTNPMDTITSLTASPIIRQDNLIEIVYAYTRQIDENGVPAIYCTVFSPLIDSDLYAKHELLDYAHGEYPFVEYKREMVRRPITESRGVPEIAMTDQDEIKAQHDSIRDRTAFETLPPMKVVKRIGQINKIGPGVQLPVTNQNDYSWLEAPNRAPNTAFSLIERVENNHANYFALNRATVPPIKAQLMQQQMVNRWLTTWSKIYNQMFTLCLQYMPEEEVFRITGMQLPSRVSEISSGFDFILNFNVQSLDSDLVAKKLEAFSRFIIPMDRGGVVNINALVKMLIEAVAPESAKDLIMNQQDASQQMFKDVQSDIGMMMLGNEPLYRENDPSAQTRMQFAQDILTKNPKAQLASQQDPVFQALLQNYIKNLQMSIAQQQNAQIGRLGVSPVEFGQQQQQPA
jgi:hypothetical protein